MKAIEWPAKREARLQAVLLRDQRRAERTRKASSGNRSRLLITLSLIDAFLLSSGGNQRWVRKQRRHILFWRSKLGRKKNLRNIPRAVFAEALRDEPNQEERLDVVKKFLGWLETKDLIDPVQNPVSGLAIEDILPSLGGNRLGL